MKFPVIRQYVAAIGKVFLALIIFLLMLNQLAEIGGNVWLSKWSDDWEAVSKDNSQRDYYLGIYAGFGLIQG